MSSKAEKREIQLEKKVAALFSVLPGAGLVQHNVKLLGKSGIKRQIDILITQKLGPVEYRIVIDTKLKSKKVRRTDVLNVEDIREDVGAQQAIVIAPLGFDRGARRFAESNGMVMMKSVDSNEWKSKLLFPVYLELRVLGFAVTGPDAQPWMMPELGKLIEKWWYAEKLPFDLHRHTYSFDVPCVDNGKQVSALKVTLAEKRWLRIGKVPLSFFAVVDDKHQSFNTSNLSTGDIPLSEIINSWREPAPTEDTSKVLPLWIRAVQTAVIEGKSFVLMFRDVDLRIELLPTGSSIDLTVPTNSIPFQVSFRRR